MIHSFEIDRKIPSCFSDPLGAPRIRNAVSFSLALALLALLRPAPLSAQTPDAQTFRPGFSIGYEARHDRFRYQFHNPSRFNTSELVPHNFVQTYRADNHWGILRGRYAAFGFNWETELGLTPQRTTYGDDYDTFFQPDGNIIVSGTTGNVSLRSYLISQRVEIRQSRGISVWMGYRYQRDRSRFQFGNSFETQTKPPSAIFEKVPINETTRSRTHEIEFGGRRAWQFSSRWRLVGDVQVSPATLAYLTTILPEKYPGEEIVFLAKGLGLSSRLALVLSDGSFPLEVYAAYGRVWSYQSSHEFRRETSAAGIRIGWARKN